MKRLRDQAGVSLVEVVLAVAIIAVALAPLLGMFVTSRQSVDGAGRRVEAMALVRSKLDEVINQKWQDIAVETGPWTDHELNNDYQYQVRVDQTGLPDYMKRVEVEVRWQEKGQALSVRLFSNVVKRSE